MSLSRTPFSSTKTTAWNTRTPSSAFRRVVTPRRRRGLVLDRSARARSRPVCALGRVSAAAVCARESPPPSPDARTNGAAPPTRPHGGAADCSSSSSSGAQVRMRSARPFAAAPEFAVVFPGQGAQHTGMAKKLLEGPHADKVLNSVARVRGTRRRKKGRLRPPRRGVSRARARRRRVVPRLFGDARRGGAPFRFSRDVRWFVGGRKSVCGAPLCASDDVRWFVGGR